jgi:hypothetical protein
VDLKATLVGSSAALIDELVDTGQASEVQRQTASGRGTTSPDPADTEDELDRRRGRHVPRRHEVQRLRLRAGLGDRQVDAGERCVDPVPPAYLYGGGGGTSHLFAEPGYQKDAVPGSLASYVGDGPHRVVPDVTGAGSPNGWQFLSGMAGRR